MKAWLNPDLSENEYKFELFTWFDNLPDWQRTEALIKYLVTAGIDVDGLVMKNDPVSNC
jgi:hypothetical protein